MKYKKIICVFGTRPEAIKMAPVIMALKKTKIKTVVVATAQHREMLDQVLDIFDIKPDYDLDIMTQNQTLFDITQKVLSKIQKIFETEKPDLILVHGDTTTAFVSALAGFYLHIPIGHIEAGLRTFDNQNPFPEEINRQLVDKLSNIHFCPTQNNKNNLLKENIKNNVFVTGNTVIDAIHFIANKNIDFQEPILKTIDFNKKTILLTCHRRESIGKPMEDIFQAIKNIIIDYPDTQVIFPVHLNPLIQNMAKKILSNHTRIYLTKPLVYTDMVKLMSQCFLIATDSGGLQEEAPTFHKPVLVLRDETERQEGIKAGTLILVGTKKDKIYKNIKDILENKKHYLKISKSNNPYGTGDSSEKIVQILN